MRRSLSALRSFIIARRSVRDPACQISSGSGASRLQGVRHRVDCRLLVSKRLRLLMRTGRLRRGPPQGAVSRRFRTKRPNFVLLGHFQIPETVPPVKVDRGAAARKYGREEDQM
jgi:hypothetical protein